jgi:ABC-type antimicrobial peptide transport system permease subunit
MGLSAMGLYGVVSYAAKQSTHEIAIRLALGATRRDVVRRFLGRGLRLGTIGAALGIGASYAVTRLFASLLYRVSATDAVSFVAVSMLVLACVLLAAGVPAWRARANRSNGRSSVLTGRKHSHRKIAPSCP